MSLLAPSTETSPATPPGVPLAATATSDARAAFAAALHHVEDAFTVAMKHAEDELADARVERAALEKELATLATQHQELKQRHTETEQKLAVLKEVRAKLEGL